MTHLKNATSMKTEDNVLALKKKNIQKWKVKT